jgi:methionyl-tRNA formyltransferase
MRLAPSPVAQSALRHGLPLSKPESLRPQAVHEELRRVAPEAMVVAAYGLILPQAVLDIPLRGCLNVHASLLPRWRGAAPIQRAILAGDERTGISIMRMEAGLDTGPVLLERALPIAPDDTTGSLTEKLSRLGAEAIVEALARIDSLHPRPQDPSQATYAAKISKPEAAVDWSLPAGQIERQVRAFNPAPGAEATLGGLHVKIWEARALSENLPPGEIRVVPHGLTVGCGSGSLELLRVQRPGGRRMAAEEFLRGAPPWQTAETITPNK